MKSLRCWSEPDWVATIFGTFGLLWLGTLTPARGLCLTTRNCVLPHSRLIRSPVRSTLLGVLTHGELDNGRGKSRQRLFRHAHEAESGRTSSVSHDILGFSSSGEVVNKPGHDGTLDWVQICHDSAKVLTFIDLAGHERYLKTTVFGLTVRTLSSRT